MYQLESLYSKHNCLKHAAYYQYCISVSAQMLYTLPLKTEGALILPSLDVFWGDQHERASLDLFDAVSGRVDITTLQSKRVPLQMISIA
jgi:hypothetical protein